nr:uncharacterized protein LOC129277486 [Lytechinus pictus]
MYIVDSTKFTATRSTSTSNPRCVVRDHDLDIYLNHFSEFWIRIYDKLRGVFIGKRVVFTPCVPVPAPRNEEHVLLVNVRDHNVTDWKVPDGYQVPIPGQQFLVRWRSGELKISCKANNIINKSETIKESDFRNLTEHQKTFVMDTTNVTKNKIILEFTFQQSTTTKTLHTGMRRSFGLQLSWAKSVTSLSRDTTLALGLMTLHNSNVIGSSTDSPSTFNTSE